MTRKSSIYVTQPSLPPLNEFIPYLEEIWDNKILTNNGPFLQKLEKELGEYLGVEYLSLFTNGTIALVTAIQALGLTGEVITTPYSFVATSHALLWNGLKPVFVDIDEKTLNIDPRKIESAITEKTTAILPVHCYGQPCDVEEIMKIAEKYKLKVIYDAAHAFGVKDNNGSILRHGDLSILSFHATKVFNTIEGGAIISKDKKTKSYIDDLRNFGFVDETIVTEAGINGKMSEVNAAFGLLQLNYINDAIKKRKAVSLFYRDSLKDIHGIECLPETQNFSYFPIKINKNFPVERDALYQELRENDIYTRRYFYPLISEFPMYKDIKSGDIKNLPVAYTASKEILCLPLYADLPKDAQEKIIRIIATKTH